MKAPEAVVPAGRLGLQVARRLVDMPVETGQYSKARELSRTSRWLVTVAATAAST